MRATVGGETFESSNVHEVAEWVRFKTGAKDKSMTETNVHISRASMGDPFTKVACSAAALADSHHLALLSEDDASACIVGFRKAYLDPSIATAHTKKWKPPTPRAVKLQEHIMEEMTKEATRQYIDIAWTALSEEQKQELCTRFHGSLTRMLNGALEPRLKEVVMQYAMQIAEEAIAQRETELRAKVIAEVDARWEKMVESVVQAHVSRAIEKIRSEMVKP